MSYRLAFNGRLVYTPYSIRYSPYGNRLQNCSQIENPKKQIVIVTSTVMMDTSLLMIIDLLESLVLAKIRPIVATGLRKRLLLVAWDLVPKLTESLGMLKML